MSEHDELAARMAKLPKWVQNKIRNLEQDNEALLAANRQLQAQIREYEDRVGYRVIETIESD